jgi:hypothetical protein
VRVRVRVGDERVLSSTVCYACACEVTTVRCVRRGMPPRERRARTPHRGIRVGAACRAPHAPHTYCVIYTSMYIKCEDGHVHVIPRTRSEYCDARRHGEHPMILPHARLHYARAPILRNDPLGAIARQSIARAPTTTVDDRPRRDCVYHTQTHTHAPRTRTRAQTRARQT